MSGLDLLREELKRRGFTPTQVNAKSVAAAFDILSQNGDTYTKLQEAEQAATKELTKLLSECRKLTAQRDELSREFETLLKQKAADDEYMRAFNESLLECETAEGRDAMRRAQVFVNSVDVNTKYDNTAYIVALGAILSSGKIGAISELRKINKRVPAISADFDFGIIEDA